MGFKKKGVPDADAITPDGYHLSWKGTSAAAPFVTSVVALMFEKNPNSTPSSRGGEENFADKLILPPNKRYIALAGCIPNELALESDILPGRPHGLMTYGLLKALETGGRKDITYRELWSKITAAVNSVTNSQNPQIEGDLERVIFKGASERHEPSFHVTNIQGSEVDIDAGTVFGVKTGGVVAFYHQNAVKLSGEDKKITTGDIIEADKTTRRQ